LVKSEIRQPKAEGNPQPKIRRAAGATSFFGPRISSFLWISAFRFRNACPALALLFFTSALLAQSNSVINVGGGGRLIIAQPGGSQLVITGQTTLRFQNGRLVLDSPQLDPQLAAAMQFNGGEAALAQAEFDPPGVAPGQPTTYRVVITAMPEGASLPNPLPAPSGLTFAPGGHSFNYGGGPGGLQPRSTFNFRVTTSTNGVFFMPAYNASANGKTVSVPEAHLDVLPADMPAPPPGAQLVVEPPPGEFYIGQNVPVSVVLLDPGDNSVQGLGQVQVAGDAFVAEGGARTYRRETRVVRGRTVAAHVSELLVTPINEGALPLTAQATAALNRPAASSGITLPGYQPLLDSAPALIHVKHLPKDGELPGFTGAIGRFVLDPPHLSSTRVRAGDPVTLTVVVRGEGNFSRLVAPKLTAATGWQVFTPSREAGPASLPGQPGAAVFHYSLIPLTSTVKATPTIPFSYFDPAACKYVDLTIPPVPLEVTGGDVTAAALAQPDTNAESDEATEREAVMAGLAQAPGPAGSRLEPLQQRGWFLALQLLPLATLGGLWAWSKRRRFLAAHPEVVRRNHARRGIRRQLRLARKAAAARDAAGFVRASVNALREAAAPHDAANPAALVCSDVLSALPEPERQGDAGQLVRRLFVAADERQFIDRQPAPETVLGAQPAVEGLLEKWKERL
jgi:hypothetical protein